MLPPDTEEIWSTSCMMPSSSSRRITPRWKMAARKPPPESARPIRNFLAGAVGVVCPGMVAVELIGYAFLVASRAVEWLVLGAFYCGLAGLQVKSNRGG